MGRDCASEVTIGACLYNMQKQLQTALLTCGTNQSVNDSITHHMRFAPVHKQALTQLINNP